MTHLVGEKGQIVIEREIRQRLGIERGWQTVQRLVGDHVEIHFLPPAHRRSLKGSLNAHVRTRPADPDDWDAVRASAWAVAEGTAGESDDDAGCEG